MNANPFTISKLKPKKMYKGMKKTERWSYTWYIYIQGSN